MVNEKIAKFKTQFLEQSGRSSLLNQREDRRGKAKASETKVQEQNQQKSAIETSKASSPEAAKKPSSFEADKI